MTEKPELAGAFRAVLHDPTKPAVREIYNLDNLQDIQRLHEVLDERVRQIVLGRVATSQSNPFEIGVTLADLQDLARTKGWDLRRATRAWSLFHTHKANGVWKPTFHTRADELDEVMRLGLVVSYESRKALAEPYGMGKAAAELWLTLLAQHGLILRMDTRDWMTERARKGRLFDPRVLPKRP